MVHIRESVRFEQWICSEVWLNLLQHCSHVWPSQNDNGDMWKTAHSLRKCAHIHTHAYAALLAAEFYYESVAEVLLARRLARVARTRSCLYRFKILHALRAYDIFAYTIHEHAWLRWESGRIYYFICVHNILCEHAPKQQSDISRWRHERNKHPQNHSDSILPFIQTYIWLSQLEEACLTHSFRLKINTCMYTTHLSDDDDADNGDNNCGNFFDNARMNSPVIHVYIFILLRKPHETPDQTHAALIIAI